MRYEIKTQLLTVVVMAVLSLIVFSVHYIPNQYCVAAFGIPCDVNQER